MCVYTTMFSFSYLKKSFPGHAKSHTNNIIALQITLQSIFSIYYFFSQSSISKSIYFVKLFVVNDVLSLSNILEIAKSLLIIWWNTFQNLWKVLWKFILIKNILNKKQIKNKLPVLPKKFWWLTSFKKFLWTKFWQIRVKKIRFWKYFFRK